MLVINSSEIYFISLRLQKRVLAKYKNYSTLYFVSIIHKEINNSYFCLSPTDNVHLSQPSLNNESELLRRVAQGEEEAFALLLDIYRNKVFSHALTYMKVYEEAEELVQDIFVKLWNQREKLIDVVDFKNYLFILSRNQIISAMRKRTETYLSLNSIPIYEDIWLPDQQLEVRDVEKRINEGVGRLPPQQKAVFTLSRIHHHSQEEIATQLGITVRTVKFHMALALNFLREFLRDPNNGHISIFLLGMFRALV